MLPLKGVNLGVILILRMARGDQIIAGVLAKLPSEFLA